MGTTAVIPLPACPNLSPSAGRQTFELPRSLRQRSHRASPRPLRHGAISSHSSPQFHIISATAASCYLSPRLPCRQPQLVGAAPSRPVQSLVHLQSESVHCAVLGRALAALTEARPSATRGDCSAPVPGRLPCTGETAPPLYQRRLPCTGETAPPLYRRRLPCTCTCGDCPVPVPVEVTLYRRRLPCTCTCGDCPVPVPAEIALPRLQRRLRGSC